MTQQQTNLSRNDLLNYSAWSMALVSLVLSLYFSEIVHFAPCALCWYQRIAMYPLVPLMAVGIIRKDRKLYSYVLPLSIIGLIISSYHTLLQYGIVPHIVTLCQAGVSCTDKYINLFGFVTLPLLSFLAFAFITLCMLISKKENSHDVKSRN